MAKRKTTKPEKEYPKLQLRGRITQTHPTWGGGRPILVGDTAQHEEYGVCRISEVYEQTATIIDRNAFKHHVGVAELWLEVVQVPTLATPEAWPALLGKKD